MDDALLLNYRNKIKIDDENDSLDLDLKTNVMEMTSTKIHRSY